MAEILLDGSEEVRREDESCAGKGYVYENNYERYIYELGMGAKGNRFLRLVRRGRRFQRLEERYNTSMLVNRGDAERCSATVVLLVGIDIVPCEQ